MMEKLYCSKVGEKPSPALQPCREVIFNDRKIHLSVKFTLFEKKLSAIGQKNLSTGVRVISRVLYMAISGDIGMEQVCGISSDMYKSQMRVLC